MPLNTILSSGVDDIEAATTPILRLQHDIEIKSQVITQLLIIRLLIVILSLACGLKFCLSLRRGIQDFFCWIDDDKDDVIIYLSDQELLISINSYGRKAIS